MKFFGNCACDGNMFLTLRFIVKNVVFPLLYGALFVIIGPAGRKKSHRAGFLFRIIVIFTRAYHARYRTVGI